MYTLDELKEFFKNDLFAMKLLGAEIIEAKDDYAKCSFVIQDDHRNAKGTAMGGAIYTLADFTFAVATNQHKAYYTVTTTSSISYMRPGIEGKLYAESVKLREGKTICFYEVNVYNDKKEIVAKASFSGTHVLRNN